MYKFSIFLCIILFFQITFINAQEFKLNTPLQNGNYEALTLSSEITEYLNNAEQQSNYIQIKDVGKSSLGKPIHLVQISKNFDYKSDKINVLIFAQQHGNEPSGKEGLLFFIQKIVEGNHLELLENVNLLLMPQVNPDGADDFERKNADGIDLNRDHLLLRTSETQVVQQVFRKYLPEISVDVHEYYPHGNYWKKFGYRKNFDIQLGGLTNINIDENIYSLFKNSVFPFVKNEMESKGYSFFEYTLGDLPDGERLRHSTVDINDGRQSIGITNTLSFIIEGMRGQEKLDSIKRRTESQYYTILNLIKYASANASAVKKMVDNSRLKLINGEIKDSVAIRLDHFSNNESLYYPLLSLESGRDSVFVVDKYFSKVKSTLNVATPKGYLIPKNDIDLVNWLKRSGIQFEEDFSFNGTLMQYKLGEIQEVKAEGYKSKLVDVEIVPVEHRLNVHLYNFVPTNQIFVYKLVTALEPQSMYGLVSYSEFEYLFKNEYFPILRVE
jgi:Zinc carboxypeptidase